MNKQLITDNFECFTHWLNGGDVLFNTRPWDDWSPVDCDFWDTKMQAVDYFVIINDEYVELRKHIAEGGVIQWFNLGRWTDILTPDFISPMDAYRIKPKPQFSVGDWLVLPNSNNPFIATTDWINTISGDFEYTLWQPTEREYCWFWDRFDSIPVLKQFSRMSTGAEGDQLFTTTGEFSYSNCEPCLVLPTALSKVCKQ